MSRQSLLLLLGVTASALMGSGCARAHAARTSPDQPPLTVPAVPPRVVDPIVDAEPAGAERPQPAEPGATSRSPRPAPRSAPKPGDTVREPPKQEPVPATESAAPAASPASPPQLRTQPGSDGQLERRVQDAVARAQGNLGRVNYGALSVEAKGQYDTAKQFIQQAGEALKQKNFVFASYLADKAETLSKGLLGR